MEQDKKALSDITVFAKYARFLEDLHRRETWVELADRNCDMHQRKFPLLAKEIRELYDDYVLPKKVLPSMRSLQFGGRPIELANNRIFNCAYLPVEHTDAFAELMFLLLGGTGAGISVQRRHVDQLPSVVGPKPETRRYLVGDSIEGWADAIKVLVEAYFYGKERPVFDLRDIRPKGARLITTGGKAPGPAPLKRCLQRMEAMLACAVSSRLRTVDVFDLCCHIADAVLAGGIRRAALITLFDRDDELMLTAKSGEWWALNAQRGRSNNSAVLPRSEVTEAEFVALMKKVKASGCGEPGVYWTNNADWGTNPCCEIALKPYQMCNLVEVNVSDVTHQYELNNRVMAATALATLQAAYTDFHYLRPIWRKTCEEDSLLGVSMTGIGSGAVEKLSLTRAAEWARWTNRLWAGWLGIKPAKRITTVKPAGTTSLVLGSSSGIHAWHAPFYLRRMRAGKDEALAQYMMRVAPALVEQDQFVEHQVVLSFPQKAPAGASLRTEPMHTLLERVSRFNRQWVRAGHIEGDNAHNVSCTISVKPDEWESLTDWMWSNRADYNGISVLPFDGGTYVQAPFEDIDEATYLSLLPHLAAINIEEITEALDETDLAGEVACGGQGCEVK